MTGYQPPPDSATTFGGFGPVELAFQVVNKGRSLWGVMIWHRKKNSSTCQGGSIKMTLSCGCLAAALKKIFLLAPDLKANLAKDIRFSVHFLKNLIGPTFPSLLSHSSLGLDFLLW